MSFDIFKSAKFYVKGLSVGTILYLYDVFVQGNSFKDISALYDSLLIMGTSMVCDVAGEFIADATKLDADGKTTKTIIIEGILSSFIYSFGYSFFLNKKYPAPCRRDNGNNYILGFGIVALSNYMNDPLSKLFS